MKTKAVMALAAIASVGLSACSPSSQMVKGNRATYPSQPATPHAYTVSDGGYLPNPAGQNASPYPSQNLGSASAPDNSGMPMLSTAELRVIGDQIFKNEGGGSVDKLVHWNDGEDFASMGIGHFTWYPAGRSARFGNTFPELLTYMQTKGVRLPGWLEQAKNSGAPWSSKAQLMQAKHTPQVQELQNLLYQTRMLQAQYIVDRTRRAMPKLVNNTPGQLRPHISNNLNAVANTPGGWYALIDYTNFKGEGLNRSGGYNGQNWGLLQVLEEMRPSRPGEPALHEFANAAMRVLERRVRNSPPARNENRWLAGWSNRVNTYRRIPV
ncbi:hypothetical protein [Thiothrix unzii]|jgi:hypothetical protein|uniref:Uncharacterized protein n=1 Tax=Thiothrix unzii TaxID=111769 RepID=A0A975IH19_9GAMM|nr:hypothetical protein [Thiothrix unzii]QTR53437.1 hypothetical protein J9260_17320 [Thiothrix unzii]